MNLVHVTFATVFAVLFAAFFIYVGFQLRSPPIKRGSDRMDTETKSATKE